MPNYLFYAKTGDTEGYTLKVLSDLLQFYIKSQACIVIKPEGIFIDAIDDLKVRSILVEVSLLANNFSDYDCKQVLIKSTNLTNLHRMLKPTKKKDSVILFIKEDDPNFLGISLQSKDSRRPYSTGRIAIQDTQQLIVEKTENYLRPVCGSASDFQKVCKVMNNISRTLRITYDGKNIFHFYCDNGGVTDRSGCFGDDSRKGMSNESDDEEDEEYPKKKEIFKYDQTFSTPYITRLSKIAGLNRTIKMLPPSDKKTFLSFKMSAGGLGDLGIYMKSQSQLEYEGIDNESDDSDE